MQAQKKFYIILGVLLGFLVIGIVVILAVNKYYKESEVAMNMNQVNTNQTVNTNKITTINTNSGANNNGDSQDNEVAEPEITQEEQEAKDKKEINKLARNFTEKFGTYSNHNDFANIKNAKVYMTEKMKQWSDNLIAASSNNVNQPYYSLATKVANTELLDYSFDNKTAKVMAEVWQTEKGDEIHGFINHHKNAELDFKKVNGSWKVDKFKWRE